MLSDDVVDEKLRRQRQNEPGNSVHHHQRQSDRERTTMLGDQLAGFFPCAGFVILGHSEIYSERRTRTLRAARLSGQRFLKRQASKSLSRRGEDRVCHRRRDRRHRWLAESARCFACSE